MEDNVMLSITAKEEGLEVRINEMAYGNIALVGLLEKIKMNLLSDVNETKEFSSDTVERVNSKSKYDA